MLDSTEGQGGDSRRSPPGPPGIVRLPSRNLYHGKIIKRRRRTRRRRSVLASGSSRSPKVSYCFRVVSLLSTS